jgi:hypothetical protein
MFAGLIPTGVMAILAGIGRSVGWNQMASGVAGAILRATSSGQPSSRLQRPAV